MRPQAYQTPEIRDENDSIIQQGTFGKKTPFVNSQNDGILDYIINNLEAIKGMSLAATIVVSSLPSAGQAGKFYLLDDGTENSGKVYIYKDKWVEVTTQAVGLSAYQIALKNGYEGTEQEWLEDEVYGDDIVSAETDSDGYFIVHTRQGKTIKTALKPLVDAKASADKAKTSETNSANSAATALASQEASEDSQVKAKTSETNAKKSESNAKSSENLAKAWAMSENSPDGITGNKSSKTWAVEAKASASNSASSASASQSSASASASSASDASTSASNAKISETNAANSAVEAAKSAENAAQFDPIHYPLKKYILDLSALDTDTFYPVIFMENTLSIEAEIHSNGGFLTAPYNQNVLSFGCFAGGWSDGQERLTIKDYYVYQNTEITIGCLGMIYNNGGVCVWLRGGMTYVIVSTVKPQLYESGWQGNSGEVATVGPTYHGAEEGNAHINIRFSPLDIPNMSAKNYQYKTFGLFEKAEKDADGNVIKDTYAKKAELENGFTTASLTVSGETSVPTPSTANNSKTIANTEFVHGVVSDLVNGAPTALDTLQELAKALGNDPNFSTTILNKIGEKESKTDAQIEHEKLQNGINACLESKASQGINPETTPQIIAIPLEKGMFPIRGYPDGFTVADHKYPYSLVVNLQGDSGTLLSLYAQHTRRELYFRIGWPDERGWGKWVKLAITDDIDAIKPYLLTGNDALYDYLHRFGKNPTLPTINAELNALGTFICYFDKNDVIKNQPSEYGQLINIPATNDGSESTQLWIQQNNGQMYHRGGNYANNVDATPFVRFLDEDDYNNFARKIPTRVSQLTDDVGIAKMSNGHLVINGSELWIE